MAKEKKKSEVRKGFTPLWVTRTISFSLSWSVVGYITYYCTDHLGLSAGIVGMMLLVSKVIDAFTNFAAAYIVDNTHSKFGKGRPWDITMIPYWICIVLMYSIPQGWGDMAKYAMVFLSYTVINAGFGTIASCVDNIYFKHACFDEKKRNSAQAVNGACSTIATVVGSILMPSMVAYFENITNGWMIMTTIIAIPCLILGITRLLTIPELDTDQTSSDDVPRVTIKETLTAFLTNKYVIIVTILYFIIQVINQFASSPATYYYTYIVGNLSMYSIMQAVSFLAGLSLFVCVPLANKFGRAKVQMAAFTISLIGCFIRFFAGTNLLLLGISRVICSICLYPFLAFSGLMMIDCMDYGEWKNKKRVEGAIFAGTGLGTTIGMGVGSALCGFVLEAFGYNGAAEAQTAFALFGIRVCYSLIPAIIMILAVVVLYFYDLDSKMPAIRAELRGEEAAQQ